jgi:drug/metabolite transporter (DMT)-like permease
VIGVSPDMSKTEKLRRTGLLLAALTAVISGISVFLNGYGVRAWAEISDPTTYTTLKNVGAAFILIAASIMVNRREPGRGFDIGQAREHPGGLLLVAVIGGSIPFVLFFEGLARASSTDAAFIHKTLVVWVAILAVTFLRERVGLLHLAAIALLVWGQAMLAGGVTGIGVGSGEWMIMAATMLWAVETVVAKRLLAGVTSLTVAVARMAGGAVALLAYGLWRGAFTGLSGVTAEHVLWIVITAVTLSAYVATWFAALVRAQAVDVTAVLVGGAIITALLEYGIQGSTIPSVGGFVMLIVGVALFLVRPPRPALVP